VQPSQANFVMARLGSESIRWLHEALRDRGILVRYFDTPELRNMMRVTVGKPAEIRALLTETEALLKGRGLSRKAS
jgi:histidinol-phosphate aminotransferase